MTEDEAKTKWCPFVRAIGAVSDDAAANRWPADPDGESDDSFGLDSSGQPHALCIASQCMAWRSRHQWFDNAQQEPAWVSYAPYAFEPGPGQEREDGYCGLAGAPQ